MQIGEWHNAEYKWRVTKCITQIVHYILQIAKCKFLQIAQYKKHNINCIKLRKVNYKTHITQCKIHNANRTIHISQMQIT